MKIIDKLKTIRPPWIILAVVIIQCLVFFPLASFRFIDGDEGYYLLAAKLIGQGKILYKDFLYPQAPLMPYVYGLWMKVFGVSWYSARLFSAITAVLIGILLYQHITHFMKNRMMGILAVLVYTFSILSFGWYTVVKTYSLSTFLLLSSYVLFSQQSISPTVFRCFLSGLLLGLSIDIRLYFIIAIPAFMIGIFQVRKELKSRFALQLWFLCGIIIALLPNLFFIFINAENYFFNNIGYHLIRSDQGFIGGLSQKIAIILRLLGLRSARGAMSIQFSILFLLNISYLISNALLKRRLDISFYIFSLLFIVCILPTPTFLQYFSIIIPFMVINCFHLIEQINSLPILYKNILKTHLRKLFIIIVTIYIVVSIDYFHKYMFSGKHVPGIRTSEDAVNWRIHTVNQVASEIDRKVKQGELVISWWPGYFVESHSAILPKMENHFGLNISKNLNKNELERYHIISDDDIERHLRKHTVCLVVLGNWASKSRYRDILADNDYILISTIDNTEFYMYYEF